MHEFKLIKRFLQYATVWRPDVVLDSGDDCAIVKIPPGFVMAMSVDTSVEGTHFLAGTDPYDIGYKSVAVSLSDAAAMGATPAWLTLALTLPKVDTVWLDRFAEGVFALLNQHNIQLVGGDLTRGPLSITTQIQALLPEGKALTRKAAKIGDDVYVTGTLGDAGLALATIQNKLPKLSIEYQMMIESRLNRPTPRIELGQVLLDIAHAAIDLSDGLMGDFAHILQQSSVGAEIELTKIPLSEVLNTLSKKEAWCLALTAGDDYELCFTAPSYQREAIQTIAHHHKTPITRIGKMTQTKALKFLQSDGSVFAPLWKGFEHF